MPQTPATSGWPTVTFTQLPAEVEVSERLLDLHSFLNLLNVVSGVISAGGPPVSPSLRALRDSIDAATAHFLESEGHSIEAFIEQADFRNKLVKLNQEWMDHDKASPEASSLLSSVLKILDARLRDYREAKDDPALRKPYSASAIETSILGFLRTSASFSGGRFQVVRTEKGRGERDHLVKVFLEPGESGVFLLPPSVLDCLRDLVANARKYSPMGGQLQIEGHQTDAGVTFSVQDEGIGIPEEELSHVVNFGYRARNAGAVPTMGAGFGLTRVLSVAARHGGHLRLTSRLAEGTVVELFIPRAADAQDH